MNIVYTAAFFAFLYLLTGAYANAQEGYGTYDYFNQQQQIQQLQNQQMEMQNQQRMQDLQRTLNSPNQRCFYTNGQAYCS